MQNPVVEAQNSNIGIEGPMARTTEDTYYCPQEVKAYIEKNEKIREGLQQKYGENPILKHTFVAMNGLNDIATICNENGERITAADIANFERCILSNGRKFGQAVGRGVSALVSDTIEKLKRPDLFLIRNAIGMYQLAVSIISEISKEEFRTQELLSSITSGNTEVYDQTVQEHVEQSQQQLARIHKRLQKIRDLPWDEKIEGSIRHFGGFLIDYAILKAFKIGATVSKEAGQTIITKVKEVRRALKAEGTAATLHNCTGPGMEGAKDFTIGVKACIEGGVEKAQQGINNIKNLQQEGKTAAQIMQEAIDKSSTTQVTANAITTENHLERLWNKLRPDELKKVGEQSLQKDIRAIKGTANDAFDFFKAQVENFEKHPKGHWTGKDKNGITFTYRETSKFGPPTIDVNEIPGVRKIKFIE